VAITQKMTRPADGRLGLMFLKLILFIEVSYMPYQCRVVPDLVP
jgi:hypothetical protein